MPLVATRSGGGGRPVAARKSDRHPSLAWARNARPFWLKSGGLQEGNHIDAEDRIVIQNGVAIGSRLRKSFAQLLHDPIGRWMPCPVEIKDPAALVLDDKEAVQQSKVDRRSREEVEGDNRFSVILQERQPF